MLVMVCTISSFLLEASDDSEKLRRVQPSVLLHVLGNVWCRTLLQFHFQKAPAKNVFVLRSSCMPSETAVLLVCPVQKTLAPVKPKSIKEFQAQRTLDTARQAQIYLSE